MPAKSESKNKQLSSKTRLFHAKMNDHSLQQKMFTVNISTCQPIYKVKYLSFSSDFSGFAAH